MWQLWKSADKRLTGQQYSQPLSTFCSHTTEPLPPFEYKQDTLEKQNLKEKKAKVPYKETNEWFSMTRKRMVYSPQLVLSFSTQMRRPDKLAIRKVIWQAVQSAFASWTSWSLVLHPYLILRKYAGSKRLQRKANDSRCVKHRSTWLSMAHREVSLSVTWQPAVRGLHTPTAFLLSFLNEETDLIVIRPHF